MAKGEPPANFDLSRLQATAESLAQKRKCEVALTWPRLAAALGLDFASKFGAFSREQDPPGQGGPRADGRNFASWLEKSGTLPDEGRIEALTVDLRYRRKQQGLEPRRGPTLRGAWLPESRKILLAVRLPGIGERWLQLRLATGGR